MFLFAVVFTWITEQQSHYHFDILFWKEICTKIIAVGNFCGWYTMISWTQKTFWFYFGFKTSRLASSHLLIKFKLMIKITHRKTGYRWHLIFHTNHFCQKKKKKSLSDSGGKFTKFIKIQNAFHTFKKSLNTHSGICKQNEYCIPSILIVFLREKEN